MWPLSSFYLVLMESTSFPVFSEISVHNGSSIVSLLVTLLGFPTYPFHFLFVWSKWNLHLWSVSEITVHHGSSVLRFSQIQLFFGPLCRYSPRQSRIKQPHPQASAQENPAAAGPAEDYSRFFHGNTLVRSLIILIFLIYLIWSFFSD